MGPHDAERLREGAPNCSEVCECGVSLCIYGQHQPWLCECGHDRIDHLLWIYEWYGYPLPIIEFGAEHPHACLEPGCDCKALRFRAAYLMTDDELAAGLRFFIVDLEEE